MKAQHEVDLGSLVLGPANEKLGHVCRREADTFTIRMGHLIHNEVDVPYEDIASVQAGEIHLRRDPTVFSESDAVPDTIDAPTTGGEAGYDFGGDRKVG